MTERISAKGLSVKSLKDLEKQNLLIKQTIKELTENRRLSKRTSY